MKANLYKLLCLVLALCLMLSISPAAYAGELTDAELDAIINGGLTQDQINDLVNGGELDTLLPSGPGNLMPGTDKNDAYIPETLPVFPDQPVGGTANVVFPFEPSLCRTVKETADEVLTYLDARNTDFTVYFWTNEADISALVEKILDMAQTHTGREKLGDYLRFHIAGYNVSMNSYEWSGKTYVKAVFQVTYYTTAQQEQELEQKFNQVMASLNLSGKSDYEKVKAIYDYITSHVTYDHDHKNNENYHLQFSAYAALVQGTAVCQGYANLFYRMALAAGLDCRIVTGWGQNEDHGWNIVRVDGKYYNVDPTWDAGRSDYKYFLKSNKDFPEHTVNFEKHGQHFFSDYPISEANYDPAQEHVHTPIASASKMDATCTTDGKLLTITRCETCGEELGREVTVIPAHGHAAQTPVRENEVKATCEKAGGFDEVVYCAICKQELSRTAMGAPALGHVYQDGKCARCGEANPDFVPDQTTPPVPVEPETCDHLSVTVTSRQEPTCTQAGKTEAITTCQKCGEELDRKTAIIPALNHDFQNGACTRCGQEDHEHVEGQPVQEILTQPTCTEDGRYVNVCYCTVCGQELKRDETPTSIPKLGHKKAEAVEENRTEPTCTAAGSVDHVVYCATCGQELNREKVTLPKLGHNEGQPTEENRVEATCAAAGSYDLVTRCTHCGVILSSDTITLPTPDHTWDEGKVTTEPTQVPHGEKTYTCTVCGETRVEKLEHVHSYTDNIVRPTCEKPGYTEHTCACGRRYEDDHVKALGHDYEEGLCTVCGGKDPTYRPPVEEADRCAGADRFSTALLAADRMKENLGLEKFDAVVVASGTNFADALSGSYLATVMDAPILLTYTTDKVNEPIKEYIRENLIKGGTVYILGGTGAVPESFEDGLYGFRVKRLAGESRFETNLKILEEAGVEDQPILVCTGLNFADSLSASATKLPVLLVWNELSKEQTAFLESLSGNKIYILGGEGAVSAKMHKQLSYYSPVTRLGGRDRFETSAMIAREFFEEPSSAVLAYAWNFPDGLCGGPLAASMNAPLLLTMEGYEKYAAAYTKVNSITDGIVLGGESLIPETTASLIFRQ